MKRTSIFQSKNYRTVLLKFKKLHNRILSLVRRGEFKSLSRLEQKSLTSRFQLMYKRLVKMEPGTGLKSAGITMAFTLLTGLLNAQPYVPVTGEDNPLGGKINPLSSFDREQNAAPELADIDNDGDMDVFVGDTLGNIAYYKNNGDFTFTEQTGTDNPFDGVNVGARAIPRLVDIDNDLDYDAFIGAEDGTLRYFKNEGSENVPVFVEVTGVLNPFDGVDVSAYASPAFVDIDNDGDYDSFVGNKYGTLRYFENTGDNEVPVMQERTGTDNPAGNIDLETASNPVFADLDNDGDQDILVGEKYDALRYYENTGSANAATFQEITGTSAPMSNAILGQYLVPDLVDIDGDNDFDAFIGNIGGEIKYYNNEGTASNFDFVRYEPIDVGYFANTDFTDIDNDGDQDAFAGAFDGNIYFFENLGNDTDPNFRRISGVDNPLEGKVSGYMPSVEFVDINNDGDFDVFVGNGDGDISFYANDGDAGTALFDLKTGTQNPFNGVSVDSSANVTFVDIDNDEDMDAFIGNYAGEVHYFENNGSKTVPIFVERFGTDNPFDGETFNDHTSPEFADVDGDGDYDVLIGTKYGFLFYENTGTMSEPVFTKVENNESPFYQANYFAYNRTPAFVDINADTDLDLFFGRYVGEIEFFENQALQINAWPTVGNLNCGQTLADATLNGGSATAPGQFQFADPDFAPEYGTSEAELLFVPDDTDTYDTQSTMVDVTVQDIVSPVIVCVSSHEVTLDGNESSYAVSGSEFDLSSIDDNCGVETVENDLNNSNTLDGELIPVGTTTVTWTVTDAAGNSIVCDMEITVNSAVGIHDLIANGLSVYPNPARENLTIALQKTEDKQVTVSLTNLTGQKVFDQVYHVSGNGFETNINLADINQGIYIITITNGEKSALRKVIVK